MHHIIKLIISLISNFSLLDKNRYIAKIREKQDELWVKLDDNDYSKQYLKDKFGF